MKKEVVEKFKSIGVDVNKAMRTLAKVKVSIHCWQLDDVQGFENAGPLTGGIESVDRADLEPRHFDAWVNYARERGYGLDFNPTCFSSPMVKDNMTLSSPDENIRNYWIKHCIASRKISNILVKNYIKNRYVIFGFPMV